jgi:hypothetical protein
MLLSQGTRMSAGLVTRILCISGVYFQIAPLFGRKIPAFAKLDGAQEGVEECTLHRVAHPLNHPDSLTS